MPLITLSSETGSTPMDAWSIHTAVTLHFNPSSDYDAFKFNFKGPRCKRETFMSHRHRTKFEKLASRYSNRNDLILYCVANVIAGNSWIGECTDETYDLWQSKIQKLDYSFEEDMNLLSEECVSHGTAFDDAILPRDRAEIPLIYKLYNSNTLQLETLAVLENLVSYTSQLDKELFDPLEFSKKITHKVKKYAPFMVQPMKVKKYTDHIIKIFTKV